MFCPQCGSTQNDDLKFCKSCGANLQALRQIMATRDTEGKFDWSKTWVAEMFMSGEETTRRAAEIERLQGKTPEVKRRNEIKAGVITASAGLGLMIFLAVFMQGIIAGGRVSDVAIEILSRVWVVGIIPLLVGFALIFNGMFVSKTGASDADATSGENKIRGVSADSELTRSGETYLPPANTNDLATKVPFSVTDQTTKHLKK
jgi:hypothetical protein